MQCKAPLAKAGFSKFDASIAPSDLPAPTNKCNSSIKSKICSLFSMSLNTDFSLSSNSPRNLLPATKAPKSSTISFLFLRLSGTSLFTILWAKPSTIAVFPTPGCPINTGLFLVLRDKT